MRVRRGRSPVAASPVAYFFGYHFGNAGKQFCVSFVMRGYALTIAEPNRCKSGKGYTVKFDNGKEFAEHEKILAELKAAIYFAHPYHSWEWGLNKNSNGFHLDTPLALMQKRLVYTSKWSGMKTY